MSDGGVSPDNDDIRKVIWYLKQASPFTEDNSWAGSIATSVITNKVENMEGKIVFKYSLKRSEKVKIYQGDLFWQTVVILTLTIVMDINCEYIPRTFWIINLNTKSKKASI